MNYFLVDGCNVAIRCHLQGRNTCACMLCIEEKVIEWTETTICLRRRNGFAEFNELISS